jgi:hypothetical protein
MNRTLSVSILLCLALGAFTAVLAGDDVAKKVELTGYITDEWCGAKNANADGVACARACAEKGSKMAVFSDGKLYVLSDKKAALDNLGVKVVVTGTLDEEGVVQVEAIEKVEDES